MSCVVRPMTSVNHQATLDELRGFAEKLKTRKTLSLEEREEHEPRPTKPRNAADEVNLIIGKKSDGLVRPCIQANNAEQFKVSRRTAQNLMALDLPEVICPSSSRKSSENESEPVLYDISGMPGKELEDIMLPPIAEPRVVFAPWSSQASSRWLLDSTRVSGCRTHG